MQLIKRLEFHSENCKAWMPFYSTESIVGVAEYHASWILLMARILKSPVHVHVWQYGYESP